MTFAYREYDKRTFAEITKGLKIKTDADYRANMHHFAAKPNFKVSLQHSTPNFSHFQIKKAKDQPWETIKGDSFDLNLGSGESWIYARSVNSF